MTVRARTIAGGALAIAVVVIAFCERRAGIQIGQIGEKITASAEHVKVIETAVVAAEADAKVETKKLVTKNADYRGARSKVELKGDTVVSDGQRVELPSVVAALLKADSLSSQVAPTVVTQARSDSLQSTLVGALDHHIDLVQEMKKPRIGLKTGIAIGVVGTAVVVIIAVKILKAVGHR